MSKDNEFGRFGSPRFENIPHKTGAHRGISVYPRSPAEALEPARAPEPPDRKVRRPMVSFFTFLNRAFTLIVICFIGLGGLFYFVKLQFDKDGPLNHATIIVIPSGEGVNQIATRLEEQGIISDRRLFMLSALYFKAQKKLKAGEYEIKAHSSMRNVLDTLSLGKSILYKITIPEGLTSEQIVERLSKHSDLSGEVSRIPPEGSLLPDTYKFSRGTTRDSFLIRMQAEQKKFIAKLWDNRAKDLPFKTIQEAIILASIVEKETGRADERGRIAGVFVNRLKRGIRLQSDPTIIYGLVGGKGKLGRPILRSEINQHTPYNTYRISGLPPTPIANPGRSAIEAVLNPVKTNDLFFVADGTGGHVFSETLRGHRKNVRKWRQIEKEIRARQAAQKAAKENAASSDAIPAGPGIAVSGIAGISIPEEKKQDEKAGKTPAPNTQEPKTQNSNTGAQETNKSTKQGRESAPAQKPEQKNEKGALNSQDAQTKTADIGSASTKNSPIPLPVRKPAQLR